MYMYIYIYVYIFIYTHIRGLRSEPHKCVYIYIYIYLTPSRGSSACPRAAHGQPAAHEHPEGCNIVIIDIITI